MHILMDTVLFLAWVSAYLGVLCWLSRLRRRRALGPLGRGEYRADRDAALRLAMLIAGGFLAFLVYLATRMTRAHF